MRHTGWLEYMIMKYLWQRSRHQILGWQLTRLDCSIVGELKISNVCCAAGLKVVGELLACDYPPTYTYYMCKSIFEIPQRQLICVFTAESNLSHVPACCMPGRCPQVQIWRLGSGNGHDVQSKKILDEADNQHTHRLADGICRAERPTHAHIFLWTRCQVVD